MTIRHSRFFSKHKRICDEFDEEDSKHSKRTYRA